MNSVISAPESTTTSLKRALITGISGQDGALLAAHLLQSGVAVVGTRRAGNKSASGTRALWRLAELGISEHPQLRLCELDLDDVDACRLLVADVQPEAVFHLAGQSRVAESFRDPLASVATNGLGTLHLLEAVRAGAAKAHFVLAASAEIFGTPTQSPQDERTPLAPVSPYGLSKLVAHVGVQTWRASFELRASSAILFNHESELRDEVFVTRKISRAAARIKLGRESVVTLGNLDARRDFGYAPEYVAALATMATRARGDDYVLATGRAASVRYFATAAFAAAGIKLDWIGKGVEETGVERGSGTTRVRVDPAFFRPLDAPVLVGNAAKAKADFGFSPTVDLTELTRRMVAADVAREQRSS